MTHVLCARRHALNLVIVLALAGCAMEVAGDESGAAPFEPWR